MADVDLNLPTSLREDVQAALDLWARETATANPLAHLTLVKISDAARQGDGHRATTALLEDVVDSLAETNPSEAEALRLRFQEGLPAHAVANRLHVSEATVFRWQRQGIDLLAARLAQMERAARQTRLDRLAERLEPPTQHNLVGVDEHVDRLATLLSTPGPPWLVAVEGMGGIGKTSVADAVVRRAVAAAGFDEIGWVSARQQRFGFDGTIRSLPGPALTADALIEDLAAQLLPDLPLSTPAERKLAALQACLAEQTHLVVVDNLETLADVESLLPVLRRLADPGKFLLTSRHSLFGEPDLHHYKLPGLDRVNALRLVRQEARLRNLPDLAAAGDDELGPIYDAVGGNPLALRLVVGQTHIHSLPAILANLAAAQGQGAESLYTFIYRQAWDALDEPTRTAFVATPLVPEAGGTREELASISGLDAAALDRALARLVSLNLVDSRGDLQRRRYAIHNLTRSFLHRQVVRWQT